MIKYKTQVGAKHLNMEARECPTKQETAIAKNY